MQVGLPLLPPFDSPAALAALAAHAVPGLETVDLAAGTCTRLFNTGAGPVGVTATLSPDAVDLDIGSDSPAVLREITTAVRGWLDLDLEPERVAAALGTDPVLGPLLADRPGLRILGYPDGFEGAVCTVIGQQVSLAAARTFTARLVSAFGSRTGTGLAPFPAPDALAAAGPDAVREAVGLTGARARTVQILAEACADGLDLSPDTDHADTPPLPIRSGTPGMR